MTHPGAPEFTAIKNQMLAFAAWTAARPAAVDFRHVEGMGLEIVVGSRTVRGECMEVNEEDATVQHIDGYGVRRWVPFGSIVDVYAVLKCSECERVLEEEDYRDENGACRFCEPVASECLTDYERSSSCCR